MGFFKGIGYYFKGLWFLITHPCLWIYVILPWPLTFSTLVGVVWGEVWLYSNYAGPWIHEHVQWAALQIAVKTVVILLFFIFGLIWTYVIANLLSGPFNKLLSKKVEKITTGQVIDVGSGSIFKSIWDGIKSLVDYALICVILLLVNLIPVAGQIATVVITSYYAGMAYLDYVFERRNLDYQQKKKKANENLDLVIGFGLACSVAILIPPFTLFIIPINVVAGTLLALEKIDFGKSE